MFEKMKPNMLSFPNNEIFIGKENNMRNTQYKRTDRSVSPTTAQKISNSLKSYNATHPRGKASDGSEWSKRISDSLRNNYWAQIPPKQTNDTDTPPQNGF